MGRTTFPRVALTGALQWLRLPISGLELATRQRENPTWPPALAFGKFEAGVKQIVGSILRDDGLVEEGRVQQTKLAELRRAVGLDVQADQQRADAHRELEEQRAKAAIERRAAQTKANTANRAIEHDQRAAEQRAERHLDEETADVEQTAQVRAKRVASTTRSAQRTRVDAESAALSRQRRAVSATKSAAEAADALDTKKAERKAEGTTAMARNSTNSRHVVPHPGGGWDVKAPNAKRASSHHDTQKQAERRAKEIVRNLGGGEVRIHGENGRIRDSDTVPAKDP